MVAFAFLACASPLSAQAPGSLFILMLRQADKDGLGFVRRSDVDAAMEARSRAQVENARAVWADLLRFMELPADTQSVDPRDVAEAMRKGLREAGEGGPVTRAKAEAYAARKESPRAKVVADRLMAADLDGDGVVSEDEAKVELDEDGAKEPLTLAESVKRAEALGIWQARSVDTIFERYADPDGRLDIAKLERTLREMAEKAAKQ